MRCKACDKELTDSESTRKGLFTGEYIDLCDECYDIIKEDVPIIEGDPDVP